MACTPCRSTSVFLNLHFRNRFSATSLGTCIVIICAIEHSRPSVNTATLHFSNLPSFASLVSTLTPWASMGTGFEQSGFYFGKCKQMGQRIFAKKTLFLNIFGRYRSRHAVAFNNRHNNSTMQRPPVSAMLTSGGEATNSDLPGFIPVRSGMKPVLVITSASETERQVSWVVILNGSIRILKVKRFRFNHILYFSISIVVLDLRARSFTPLRMGAPSLSGAYLLNCTFPDE